MSEVFGTKSIRPFMLVMAFLSILPLLLISSAVRATDFAYDSVIRGLVAAWIVFPLLWVIFWLRGFHKKESRSL